MAENPNSRYPTQTTAPTADYPYGSAQNVSVPGDGTGTPWEKDLVNDIFGMQQQLLSAATIVPSGTPDKVGASQYYDAMRLTGGYPGLIVPMAINVDPSTLGMRVLLLDGSGILRASYSDLDSITYVGDVANPTAGAFYRADDAAGTIRNTTGAYLILPDARGRFPRGLDTTGSVDPDGASRNLGDQQVFAIYKHFHIVRDKDSGTAYETKAVTEPGAGPDRMLTLGGGLGVCHAETITSDGYFELPAANQSTQEGRPVNFAVNWGVWY
jgi:hypothetical protein